MSRIATAIGIAKSVIQENHPSSTIKSIDSGPCDFRVSSVGASIIVTENGEPTVTEEDISEIEERGTTAIPNRRLEYHKKEGNKVWFELHS